MWDDTRDPTRQRTMFAVRCPDMARRRPRRVRILLPGEREGRRGFLKKGLFGAVLLAAGGGGAWLATRRTRPRSHPSLAGPFQVLTPAQAAVVLAIAERVIPEHPGFPRPGEVGLPAKVDAIAAMAHPATQKEIGQLVGLFESALGGLLDWSPRLFTECDPAGQDRRLWAWARSRIAVRRTGFRALRRLVCAAYYASPETWGAVGYPGPPLGATPRREPPAPAAQPAPAPGPASEDPVPPPRPRRFRPAPVEPAPVEPAPVEPLPLGPTPAPAPAPGGGLGP
jgi:hypothetical protein